MEDWVDANFTATQKNWLYDTAYSVQKQNETIVIQGLSVDNIDWIITGTGTGGSQLRTIGYVSIIDRSVNASNQPIHTILPVAPSDPPPYPEYSFFLSNDVNNALTNNLNSIRLNYAVNIRTAGTVSDVTNISFYASRGLADGDGGRLVNRAFTVSVSTNASTWTNIGTATPGAPASNSVNFSF
ncbi:MAG: hypothetical protein EA375_04645, partial [Acholeplasmataceae bacterium]